MKLGEALNERARLAKRVGELRHTLEGCIVIQEGETAAADPGALLAQSMSMIDEIEGLVAAINYTNSVTMLPSGLTLTEALAARDALGAKVGLYDFAIDKLTKGDPFLYRRTASELKQERLLKYASTVSERDYHAQLRRELEAELQEVNWTTELIESR